MTVTIVSCIYGARHYRFFDYWWDKLQNLTPAADRVIVATDGIRHLEGPDVLELECRGRHPQAFYQQQAARLVDTDWIWFHDIDDIAMLDALEGLGEVEADVWQMGFLRSDGQRYVPPMLTNSEYLNGEGNPYVSGSAVRTDALAAVGGVPDVAFQDWALWRRLAENNARFHSSGRANFHYMRHPYTRSELELTADKRAVNVAEMIAAEEGMHLVA